MRYAAPGWLWLLLVLPIAYLVLAWADRRRREAFSTFIAAGLWPRIAPELDPMARPRKLRVLMLAIAFALLALARPQWGMQEETVRAHGLDVMIALDVSNSMLTEDVVPSRLRKAKHLVRTLADGLGGDRLGVVAFAASGFVACPLTTDLGYFLGIVDMLEPRSVVNQGTDIAVGLETALKSLDRGAEDGGPASSSRVVVLISDGENHEEAATGLARRMGEQGIKLFVFGVGTQKGGPVPVRDESGNLHGYKKDASGQTLVSRFDPEALSQLAGAASGRYWNVTTDESEARELIEELGSLARGEREERKRVTYKERYQWPLLVALLLLLLEISLPARKRANGRSWNAPGNATAALLLWIGFGSVLTIGSQSAQAGPTDSIGAYIENEKGIDALRKGDSKEAREKFGAAKEHAPDSPTLDFNEGVARFQAGDLEGAVSSFDAAAKAGGSLGARSLFNKGATLAKKGDTAGAMGAYFDAIEAAKKAGDSQAEADTRKNLELLVHEEQQKQKSGGGQSEDKQDDKKKDQQKQDQQKQGQGKDQDKNDKHDDPKNDPDKDSKKQQPKKYQGNSSRNQKFQSKQLSPDDAERVLAEMKNREKQLQKKLNRQEGKPRPNDKDW